MAKSVRFTTSYPPYNANEIAQFSDNVAERLVAQGVATASGFTANATLGAELLRRYRAGDSATMADHGAAGFQHSQ